MSTLISQWANGLNGWMASDPKEQGWQDHLFDVVDTNESLFRWGECNVSNNKITLPPVPTVPGASGPYLYMKDCGEFDTKCFKYDLGYLEFAFGMPKGVKGAAANNFIDDILINRVGIDTAGQGKGAQCLSSTGNYNGLHAYNDYDWNLISKEVLARDGDIISFGWSFQGGDAAHGNDAAFWLLKDAATGEIVAADLLAQGPTPASGIARIEIPDSSTGHGNYVLTIGQMNVGKYNSNQKEGNPHMLIGPIVMDAPPPEPCAVIPRSALLDDSAPDIWGDADSLDGDASFYDYDEDSSALEVVGSALEIA
ncbi:MAG: hypothetical protein LBP86_01560 [Azoarcus sp.]|nr:hypothetical protein [Azoarcus sp.]